MEHWKMTLVPPVLRPGHDFLVIAASGVATSLIFRRWEPLNIPVVSALALIVPGALSMLLLRQFHVSSAVLSSLCTYYAALFVSVTAYRLSPFHPLARYPGPLLCKLTALHMVRVARTGKRHLYVKQLHEQYGDIVRTGPNELSVRNPAVVQPLLGTSGLPKGHSMDGQNMYLPTMPLIAIPDAAEHARRRRPWNRAFNTAGLKEYQPVIARRALQLVEGLQREHGVIDLAQWISFFTYDFMGDMAFGGGTEMLKEGDKDGLWKLLKEGMGILVAFDHAPWLAYYLRRFPATLKALVQLRALAFERTNIRYQRGSATKDLFYYLSNEDGAERVSPPRQIVISDGILAVIAGSDTTATTLSNIFFHLLDNPECYRHLQEEVDKYYPPGENALDPVHHSRMPYLEAVINEGMRMHPAVASGSIREAPRGSGGRMCGPYFVPESTQIRTALWAMHHDARNFSHPDTFWPDRWLIAEDPKLSSEKLIHNVNAFLPFSFGPSNCVGKNLALLEMRMVLCLVMQKLELRLDEGWDRSQWSDQLEDVFVSRMGSLPVTVQLRD